MLISQASLGLIRISLQSRAGKSGLRRSHLQSVNRPSAARTGSADKQKARSAEGRCGLNLAIGG
jgi:hypothetical protein